MYESAQRLSVVLEHDDGNDDWVTVAVLIHESGHRQRSTLGRFATRAEAAKFLDSVYESLPRRQKVAV